MNTFIEVLENHAQNIPNQTVFTFLNDRGEEVSALSYLEFHKKSKSIGSWLQKKFGKKVKGARVLLLYEPGLEFICGFLGCLYAGAIPVPAYPPEVKQLNKSLQRINQIVKNAEPLAVFTNQTIEKKLKLMKFKMPVLYFKPIIATDKIKITLEKHWQKPDLNAEDIAFLQYTSGSTSEPKGVMVTHQNLLHNSKLIKEFYGHDQNSTGVIWLPFYHDMGLIGGLLQTIYLGTQTWLISPLSFIKNPYLWLKLISEKKATTSGGPNFAYELCLKGITPKQRQTLDLSHWQIAFSGAEPVKAETINKFSEYFSECGFKKEAFYPCYGLAEATLIVSGGQKLKHFQSITRDGTTYVSCGSSHPDQTIKIVDPEHKIILAEDSIGEIWVAGPSIAKGYWKNPALTQEVFGAQVTPSQDAFLRTGDLGFLNQNNLYITGRIKDLMIINGKNYYPQDIELTVQKNALWMRAGAIAAFSIEAAFGEKLIVVAEVNKIKIKSESLPALIQKLNEALWAEHQLRPKEIIFIEPRTMPKTSSGKLQRYLVKKNYVENKLERVLF